MRFKVCLLHLIKKKAQKLWVTNYSYGKYHMFENFEKKLHLHFTVKEFNQKNNNNNNKNFTLKIETIFCNQLVSQKSVKLI